MTFLPADFDTAESLWEQGDVTAEQEAAFAWEPSQEDREWHAAQVWAEMTA